MFNYAIALLLLTYFDKKIGLSYEDHTAVVFTSVGKNEGTRWRLRWPREWA
ncbi:hypothetical protein [Thermococcus celer]|uniref:hypothetical protein n=1 Tax=Thermococcus celer TaxID=2264 RepID=UPI000AADA60C|nr:hypothetical protein [Thermococcus celer]